MGHLQFLMPARGPRRWRAIERGDFGGLAGWIINHCRTFLFYKAGSMPIASHPLGKSGHGVCNEIDVFEKFQIDVHRDVLVWRRC